MLHVLPTSRGGLPKLNHLAQTDAGGRERRVMLDGLVELVRRFPRHDEARLFQQLS